MRWSKSLDAWSSDADDIRNVLKAIAQREIGAATQPRHCRGLWGNLVSTTPCGPPGARIRRRACRNMDRCRKVITVRQSELGPVVLWEDSRTKWREQLRMTFDGIAVITGFIAVDEEGSADNARAQWQRLFGGNFRCADARRMNSTSGRMLTA